MINGDRKIEVRLFGALLAITLASRMVIDALWILSPQTIISKVAQLSTYPEAVSGTWFLAAALVVPYFFLQVIGVPGDKHRPVVKLACRALMLSAVVYGFLGFQSRNLDYDYVTESFVVMSFLNMGMAYALAHGLNAAQKRKEEAAKVLAASTPDAVAKQEQKDIEHCTEAVEQQRKEDAAL